MMQDPIISIPRDNVHGRNRWRLTTPTLWFCCVVYAWGDVMFGYDTGIFGGLQALPSFLNDFGEDINGVKALTNQRKSIMNSIVWIGKISGTLSCEPILERIGYRYTMYIVVFFQTLAVIVELSAKNWVAFSIGRIFAYYAVGLVENAVPSYASELAPVPLRTFFSASINWVLGLGSIWGSVMNRVYADHQTRAGWIIPTAMQFIPAVILAVCLPFTVESPRWLVSKGRMQEAARQLDRFRTKEDVASGMTELELQAIEQAIAEANSKQEGRWIDIFRGTYFRRASIAQWMFIFQQARLFLKAASRSLRNWLLTFILQITGNQFLNLYGPTFYKSMGLGSMAFTYSLVGNAPTLVVGLIALFLYDKVGRRPIMILGSFLQVPFLIIVAVVGSKASPNQTEIHTMVASFILFGVWAKIALTQPVYSIASEIGGTKMRKKVMGWATSWDVLAAFAVSYSCPYLIGSPGANLKAKVGYIFAGISFSSFIFILFFVPELKGRSLEEIDELFDRRLWAWQFTKIKTTGVGARITALEGGEGAIEDVEQGKAAAEAENELNDKGRAQQGQHVETLGR